MNLRMIFQKDGKDTLSENIIASFNRKPKKVYFLLGSLRETGFKIIEEEMIDNSAKIFFAIGIDKKNTTRSMLENILNYTKDLYVYSNNQIVEFESNICIFEYAKETVMYISTSNLSESGIKDNLSLYTEIIYNLEDKQEKEEYKLKLKELLKQIESDCFTKVNKEAIEKLVEDKEIFTTRQYNHNIRSISELLGKSSNNNNNETKKTIKEENDDVYIQDIKIPKIDLSNISFNLEDIDLSGVEEKEVALQQEVLDEKITEKSKKSKVKKIEISKVEEDTNVYEDEGEDEEFEEYVNTITESDDEEINNLEFDENETLDIGSMLFSKAKVKLDVPQTSKEVKEEVVEKNEFNSDEEPLQTKKVNLNNITNLIFELPLKVSKGQDVNNIKIPNYIKNMIPDFFESSVKSIASTKDGMKCKERNLKVEIVNVKSGEKFTDREAKLIQKNGQPYIAIVTDILRSMNYDENDIIRIIKLSNDIYHIEIIAKDMQEYKLWSKLCNQNFKSSTRKFGMM